MKEGVRAGGTIYARGAHQARNDFYSLMSNHSIDKLAVSGKSRYSRDHLVKDFTPGSTIGEQVKFFDDLDPQGTITLTPFFRRG